MGYNGWKMMDKIDVAIKTSPDKSYYGRTFDAYVAEHGDKKALEAAIDWARSREWDREKNEYTKTYEPDIHTFDNGGFQVTILKSAGGSSQGGRLSFLACEVEKDGVKFVIGVNDALLVDLIRNSHIDNGVIKEKVMFVRKGGVPGFIHEEMDAYKEAMADMKQKSDLKSAKKTSKWERGGIYATLTQADICLGPVYDLMEEVVDTEYRGWSRRNKLVKRNKPEQMYAWFWLGEGDENKTFTEILEHQMERGYHYLSAGKPPARPLKKQLEVTERDIELIDKLLRTTESGDYGNRVFGRYVRELK